MWISRLYPLSRQFQSIDSIHDLAWDKLASFQIPSLIHPSPAFIKISRFRSLTPPLPFLTQFLIFSQDYSILQKISSTQEEPRLSVLLRTPYPYQRIRANHQWPKSTTVKNFYEFSPDQNRLLLPFSNLHHKNTHSQNKDRINWWQLGLLKKTN